MWPFWSTTTVAARLHKLDLHHASHSFVIHNFSFASRCALRPLRFSLINTETLSSIDVFDVMWFENISLTSTWHIHDTVIDYLRWFDLITRDRNIFQWNHKTWFTHEYFLITADRGYPSNFPDNNIANNDTVRVGKWQTFGGWLADAHLVQDNEFFDRREWLGYE